MKTNDEILTLLSKHKIELPGGTGLIAELEQMKEKWERAALEALNEKIVPLNQSEVETTQRITKMIDELTQESK